MNDPVQVLVAAVWTFVSGAAGWFAHRRFSDMRDRRNRRIELIRHLSQWRSKIERHNSGDSNSIFESYEGGVHDFNAHFNVLLADREVDADMKELGKKAGSLNYLDFLYAGGDKREIACQWIDKLRTRLAESRD